jgi:DhnA family fructose-bisphosphate aldolase class Ia
MNDGKTIRINRLLRNGKMLCVPLDHGITIGDISHLTKFQNTVSKIIENGASAIVVHKGMVRFLPLLKETGLIVHLSASTEKYKPVHKVIVCEVAEAISLGADAVSIHVNLGNEYEKLMLADFARISKDCQVYSIPLFVMMYIRNNDNEDIGNIDTEKHSIRIAAELGADIVKIGPKQNLDELKSVIKDSLIPVAVAGGDILEANRFYTLTSELMKSGILGVSFGRNIFMSENPEETMKNLANIIYTEQ